MRENTPMKKWAFSLILPVVGLLTACQLQSFSYAEYAFGELDSSTFAKTDYPTYYQVGDFSSVSSSDETYSSFSEVYRDKLGDNSFSYHLNLPSTGEQKLLVIPVAFSDYGADKLPSNALDLIRGSFFGADAGSQFYSVASYYDKASYGRLHLGGKATDWFTPETYTYESLKDLHGSSKNASIVKAIRSEALSWYTSQYPSDPLTNYMFDSDGDLAPDAVAVYLVYAPNGVDDSADDYRDSIFWAFEIASPAPTAWSSFELTYLNSEAKVDSHTYIHEVGHMLGLKDYYDVNGGSTFSRCAPTGRVDMMDYSLGDMSSYSKMLLGWCRPYVPTFDGEITLHSFSSSGEFILLADSWNGSPFDEYLLIEYYSPYYLNRVDATLREEGQSLFAKPGFKVYHVDSRLGYFNKTSCLGYVSSEVATSAYQVDIANNNSASSSGGYVDTSKILYQLLDKSSGSSKLIDHYVASDHIKTLEDGSALRDSLFYQGDSFGLTTFTDLTFHNGMAFNYSFEVTEATSNYGSIKISSTVES